MADDVDVTPGSGKTVRSEEIGGKQHQYVVPVWGPAGTGNKIDVATGKPLPVQLRSATGLIPVGEPTDNRSTATDTTSTTLVSIFKQISFSIQAAAASLASLVTAIGSTAWDLGAGAIGSRTQRIAIASDSSGVITTGSQASPSSQYVSTVGAGDVAHDAVNSGNPLAIGGEARTTNPTAVASGDRVKAIFDKLGKLISVGAIRELKGDQQTALSNTTSETTIVTAVASTFLDLYGLILANTGGTDTTVTIRDDTAGTVRAKIRVPAGETRGFVLGVDAGLNQAVVNKPWTAQCSAATTALEVTALFVKNT